MVFCVIATTASAAVFNSPDGLFVIEFPGPPRLSVLKTQTTRGTEFEERRWSARTKDGYWSVTTFVYAKPRMTNYDAAVAGTVAAVKGHLVSNRPIWQAGFDGREIVVDCGDSGVLRERIVSIEGSLYVVAYRGRDAA